MKPSKRMGKRYIEVLSSSKMMVKRHAEGDKLIAKGIVQVIKVLVNVPPPKGSLLVYVFCLSSRIQSIN